MAGEREHGPAAGVEALRAAVDGFCGFIRAGPGPAEKAWGPKEVLAHLVFWMGSYVAQLEAIAAGEPPQPPQGRFDDLNAQAVAASRGVPVEELLRRYQATQEQLCAFARTHDSQAVRLRLKEGSAPRPLAWFIKAEAGHIRHHQRALLRQATWDAAREAERLRRVVEAFCGLVEALPEAAPDEGAWGPRQVLAHLVFWHESYAAQVDAVAAGRPIGGPQGGRDELNAQAVHASRGVATGELVRRFRAADERLRRLAQPLDPQDVLVEWHWARGTWLCTLDDAIARITAHVREHQRQLARAVRPGLGQPNGSGPPLGRESPASVQQTGHSRGEGYRQRRAASWGNARARGLPGTQVAAQRSGWRLYPAQDSLQAVRDNRLATSQHD